MVTEDLRNKLESPIATPYFALSPLSELSPCSTQTYTTEGSRFSEPGPSLESETEVESDDLEFENEARNTETKLIPIEDVLAVADSIVFSALGHNFNLATQISPELHRRLGITTDRETGTFKLATSQGSKERQKSSEAVNEHQSLSSKPNTKSLSAKRGRESEEPEDLDEGGSGDSPKRRRQSPNKDSDETKLFACHFFKKDPFKYSDWNRRFFKKYSGCTGPVGRTALRHIL
jgi:hypothetical protein